MEDRIALCLQAAEQPSLINQEHCHWAATALDGLRKCRAQHESCSVVAAIVPVPKERSVQRDSRIHSFFRGETL